MRLLSTVLVLLIPACGPKAEPFDDGSTGPGETGGASDGGATSPSTSTADPSDPTTPPTTGSDPTSATSASTTGGNPTTAGTVSTATTEPPDDSSSSADTGTTEDCQNFLNTCGLDLGDFDCDVFAQDCPIGQKCAAWANDGGTAWNATKCVPVARDPNQPGDPCTVEGSAVSGLDDCDLGAMCFFVDPDTNTGTCTQLCTGTEEAPVCPPTTACSLTNDDVLNLCLTACDLDMPACPMGQVCIPSGDAAVCVPG